MSDDDSDADVIFANSIGPGFTLATARGPQGLGGSELEIVQIAHALARRGHRVIVANGVTEASEEEGVRYIPFEKARGLRTHALWIERSTRPPSVTTKRIVIRATDINWQGFMDVHKSVLESGSAALAVNTRWQAEGFSYAKEKIIIPPALDYDLGPEPVTRVPGRFVYVSAPMKGLDATLEMWRTLMRAHPADGSVQGLSERVHLKVVVPGFSDMYGDRAQIADDDARYSIQFEGMPSIIEWRRLIASAEGLFFVNTMSETFGCAAAFAEYYGARTHILCKKEIAGFEESVVHRQYVTKDEEAFKRDFIEALDAPLPSPTVERRDLSPDALAPLWEKALRLPTRKRGGATELAVVPAATSHENALTQEDLPQNREPLGSEFGTYLSLMRSAISVGGSEFGLGLMLMSLVASTRATRIVEIGRFHGFSTLALAAGLALADAGWQEPTFARQRPDVDYEKLLATKTRQLISIDPHPTKEADALIEKAGLQKYVQKIDKRSEDVDLAEIGPIDVILIDGFHAVPELRRDIARYVPHVKPGGYFLLHDYFGWYDDKKRNGSPIKRVIDEDLKGFEQLLLDTGFGSFVMFRKNIELPPMPEPVPARKDGRPTVGLVLIAKGDEAATIIARAIVSIFKQVDAVTVVSDGGQATVDVCRALGADVYQRPTPEIDWVNGDGFITRARNEALAIAERKTDYVMMLDPDDYLEGEIPKALTHDIYEMYIHDAGLRYSRAQLYRSNRGFKYHGIVHEHIVCPPGTSVARLETLKYVRKHGGHQDQQPPEIKYAKHAHWLEKWLLDHPDDTRSQFYLGQSYRDGRQPDKAIAAYEKRIMMGGFPEEVAFSACQIARIRRDRGEDPTADYLRAYELRPSRAEPLCELAEWLRDDKRKRFALAAAVARVAASLTMPPDYLFLEPRVYEWRALEELAIASYWSNDKAFARECYEKLLPRVPKDYVTHIQGMLAMCTRELAAAAA